MKYKPKSVSWEEPRDFTVEILDKNNSLVFQLTFEDENSKKHIFDGPSAGSVFKYLSQKFGVKGNSPGPRKSQKNI